MWESPAADLRARLIKYSLSIIATYRTMPQVEEARIIGRQFLRSGTSIGAHHREAGRGRSGPEFISKLETAIQELDETDYWLELALAAALLPTTAADPVRRETQELIAIFVASVKRAKSN